MKRARALARFGPNRFLDHPRQAAWRQYLRHFGNPLVLILLAASGASLAFGEIANFALIACIVLLSVTLDFIQEYRADAAAEKLRQTVTLRAVALRDGQPQSLPVGEIVVGDVVLLAPGDLTPADGLVLDAHNCMVNQALLTGEPYPVEKRAISFANATPDADLHNASHALFMGTSVVGGSARMLVVETGRRTAIGAIAGSLERPAAPNSFEIGTRRFGLLIMRLTLLMVMFVLFVNLLSDKPWLESFLFALALAVGLTPEMLPMIVSVTLSRGALRMADQGMIVKRQSAIQDLGSMDVLCTDKTGTLTEARIHVERCVDIAGRDSARVLQLAYLNSHFSSGQKNALDDALLDCKDVDQGTWRRIDEVPFDFERRRASVLIDDGCVRLLVVKGAADGLLGQCSHFETNSHPAQVLDAAALDAIRAQCRALEDQGLRVLGIAWRPIDACQSTLGADDETQLVLAGFAAFIDPPKQSSGPALRAMWQAGVTVKVVTGDSEAVTRHICAQLDLPVKGVLSGQEIAQLDDPALRARVDQANLFCRVNPMQKNRVIQALRARDHVVGYLGDGVNDAPSLHSADVGISVDSAVDVARAAADMILLRHDLGVLHDAVLEGRRTFGNLMKYIMMGTSSNFGNMFSMAGAALFLPFLPMLPTQILLNNILYDLSESTVPFDAVDAEQIRRPHTMDMRLIRSYMLTIGPISSLFDVLTFYLLLKIFEANEALFQTGWFVESLCTQVLVIFVIRTHGSAFRSRPHPLLVATSLTIVAVAIALPFTPFGAWFGFTPLPASFYALLIAMVGAYLLIVEFVKRRFFKRSRRD